MRLETLPLFPLEVVLYPNEVLPLHIFEAKFIDLISDCMDQEIPFGVVLTSEGKMKNVGCTARISKITESFEDGSMNIIVTGMERFRILQVHNRNTYLTIDFETMIDDKAQEDSKALERLIAQHIRLLELAGRTPSPSLYENRERLSFFIAHNAGLSLEQKQEVLELGAEAGRVHFLIEHLAEFIPAVQETEVVRQKVRSNGHFKDFPPET